VVISEAVAAVDLDRNRRRDDILAWGWSGPGSDPFDQRRFLSEAREISGPRIGDRLPRQGKALRTLAELRRLQGRPQEALALELEYLEQAELPEEVRHARRGWLLEFGGRPANALAEYRLAYRRLVQIARVARWNPESHPLAQTAAAAKVSLAEALAVAPAALSSETVWLEYLAFLDSLFNNPASGSSLAWMEEAVDSPELDPMARSLLCERLGRGELARVLARQAVEEGFAALRAADPGRSVANPFDALALSSPVRPRGEFVIYCRNLGPIDSGSLLRSIRAHWCEATITDSDPGFRGYRDGQVALELHYLPDLTREVQGALLLGESREGQALVYGGSLRLYLEKRRPQWTGAATSETVLRNVATYAAKHEIMVHHSGNFLLRGFRQDYRGNIRGDSYAQDGYLESNHPNDILWNLPELLSPRHPFQFSRRRLE
jgi:hypothetical protein